MIVDGINRAYSGSIGVRGERIVSVGGVSGDAEKAVDATGLTAMQGLIPTPTPTGAVPSIQRPSAP